MKKVLVTFLVALFATAVLGQNTKTAIKPGELPACVSKYMDQNLAGYKIDMAYKISNDKGELNYEVVVMKGKERKVLIFDGNCNLVKKGTPEEKKKPVTKPPQTDPAKPVQTPAKPKK